MTHEINETHAQDLESWVESANDPNTDFPIQNLPLFVGIHEDRDDPALMVRLGEQAIDLGMLAEEGLIDEYEDEDGDWSWVDASDLAELSAEDRSGLRSRLVELFRKDSPIAREAGDDLRDCLVAIGDLEVVDLPFLAVRDYTDFYASVHHATNVGSMFRPDNPLLPNYKWIPIAYHGRASSLIESGMEVRRPHGQQAPTEEGGPPGFGPCKMLDYELEVGFYMGQENERGEPISIEEAEDHILGICLLNDWSARDIQKWEYQPLGPFLSKSFATTVSPYLVTLDALAPFRGPAYARPDGDPKPLPHLFDEDNQSHGAIDLTVEVFIASQEMRRRGLGEHKLSSGSFKHMYWTIAQMLTHHTSNGCNISAGDLMASGTVSGPTRDSRGCLLELTWDGDPFASPKHIVPTTQRTPITLPTGEERKFLADGDEVIIRGHCQRDGFRRIGLGECRGIITPAEG